MLKDFAARVEPISAVPVKSGPQTWIVNRYQAHKAARPGSLEAHFDFPSWIGLVEMSPARNFCNATAGGIRLQERCQRTVTVPRCGIERQRSRQIFLIGKRALQTIA